VVVVFLVQYLVHRDPVHTGVVHRQVLLQSRRDARRQRIRTRRTKWTYALRKRSQNSQYRRHNNLLIETQPPESPLQSAQRPARTLTPHASDFDSEPTPFHKLRDFDFQTTIMLKKKGAGGDPLNTRDFNYGAYVDEVQARLQRAEDTADVVPPRHGGEMKIFAQRSYTTDHIRNRGSHRSCTAEAGLV